MAFCRKCGTKIPEGSVVCDKCKAKMGQHPLPAAKPAARAPGAPVKTSGMAIASLVMGILGFVGIFAIAGLIVGIIALRRIRDAGGALKGKGLAIAGIVLSLFFIILPIIILLALPHFFKEQALERQSQMKADLGSIYTLQAHYFNEFETYASSFDELGWKPGHPSYYTFYLQNDVIPCYTGEEFRLPPGVNSYADQNGYQIVAVGDIDLDDTVDVWTINDQKELRNLANDIKE